MSVFDIRKAPFVATLFFTILGATHLACQSMDISSDWDRAVDFSKLSSYDWMPVPEPSDPDTNDTLTRDRVHRAVDGILGARGYVYQPSGTPDFLVGFIGAVQSKLDVRTIDDYYGYRPGWGGTGARTYGREYDQGTLILDISNPLNSVTASPGISSRLARRSEQPVACMLKKRRCGSIT